MACSLLAIARRMDTVEAPQSMRELARRHRWLEGGPPDPLSLLSICRRHGASEHFEALWYNTYLIHGLELSLCNAIQAGRMIPVLGEEFLAWWLNNSILPEELIDAFNISTGALADAFALSKQTLLKDFPDVASSFVEKVPGIGWIVKTVKKAVSKVTRAEILGKLSAQDLLDKYSNLMTPDQIVKNVGLDVGQVAAAFCDRFVNAVSGWTGYPLNATVALKGDAPQRPMRARAIGRMIGEEYKIAGLCEVWEPARQDDVVAQASATGGPAQGHRGPQADGELAGSGLLTVTFGATGAASDDVLDALATALQLPDLFGFGSGGAGENMHVFSNQGSRIHDADAWSRKGVLLTVVDLGVGRLDLYTTHLYKGGDGLGEPSDEARWAVKQSQIGEIVQFIADTHKAANIAMLMGDFNIAATDVTQYGFLVGELAKADLVDLWPFWMQPASGLAVNKPHGATNDPSLCIGAPFCDEPLPAAGAAGNRIDYVFVERPRPQHSFTLDLARMRRRAFPFPQADDGFLSDHMGLHLLLIPSP